MPWERHPRGLGFVLAAGRQGGVAGATLGGQVAGADALGVGQAARAAGHMVQPRPGVVLGVCCTVEVDFQAGFQVDDCLVGL